MCFFDTRLTSAFFLVLTLYPVGAHSQTDGLFRPGSVARRNDLQPPGQSNDPTSHRFEVEEGKELYKFERGQNDGPVALVIHGGPCGAGAASWPGLSALERTHRIIYYHQRGCGESAEEFIPEPSASYHTNMVNLENQLGLSQQLADIERIRRILQVEQLTLIGHSFGGFMAAMYAAEFPNHVRKLVLVSPADMVVAPVEDDLFDLVEQHLPSSNREAYRQMRRRFFDFGALFEKSTEELAELHREFGHYYAIAQKARFPDLRFPEGARYPVAWMPYAVYFSLGSQRDYRTHLRAVSAPSLIVHGTEDLQPGAVGRHYADLLSASTFVEIEAASHFSFVENPEVFGALVTSFLNK